MLVLLPDLASQLDAYAQGRVSRRELALWLDRVLAADPLGAEANDSAPWDAAPDETRLFWRLVYLFETAHGLETENEGRGLAERVVRCLASTESAADTLELLPVLLDQLRLSEIVRKHQVGVISRTGFLSVLAESGYPDHVKLWLAHAEPAHLAVLCERLETGHYRAVARDFERPPC